VTEHSLFISDLHLDPTRHEIVDLFCHFIQTDCIQADALYILGDFFETWIGDDDLSTFNQRIIQQLKQLSQAGTKVFLMRGNRDFLLSEQFALQSHCHYLDDPTQVQLYGYNYLLMHGDTLCTQDIQYQEFRKLVRSSQWQSNFLAKSLDQRQQIAQDLREQSRKETTNKEEFIMDVEQNTVVTAIRKHDCDFLIHGHTHRLARHTITIANKEKVRMVLGDWYHSGSCIKVSANGPEFIKTLDL